MDFVDSAGTRYQLTETADSVAHAKKPVVWPWVVGGLALAGGLAWMASASARKPNPVSPKTKALIAEARDPSTSRDRLWKLVKHPKAEVRRALLDNPNLCPTDDEGKFDADLLKILAEEFSEEVSGHPLFVLYALVEPNDEFQWVVREVVERTKDVGLMERIWSTWGPSSWWVRQGVALNPKAPEDFLRLLGNPEIEEEWRVRQGVALNPNTPVDLLRILGNERTEPEEGVRYAVAANPNTPGDVLRSLGNSQTESDPDVREMVMENPHAPIDVLRTLGNPKTEPDWGVREAVARNSNTPAEVLRLLANEATEHDNRVRLAVAKNHNTPTDVLRTMRNQTTESDKKVRKEAKKALASRNMA